MSISIYQVFTRLFDNRNTTKEHYGSLQTNGTGKMNAFTAKALRAIKELGITHIWYTGLLEHATQTNYTKYGITPDHFAIVKGKAGSPYAIKDYYDIDPDLAEDVYKRQEEFDALIVRTHQAGLKMIIDFVPNHVARTYVSDAKPPLTKDFGEDDDKTKAFSPQNNFYYLPEHTLQLDFGSKRELFPYTEFPARATGNNCFSSAPSKNDWYETVKLNYGIDYLSGASKHFVPRPQTWDKMLDILFYWAARGVDGFRCDMAEMVPVEFWAWAIKQVKKKYPSVIFIAEIYNPYRYHEFVEVAGFDYLYDKVGLYDELIAILQGRKGTEHLSRIIDSQVNISGKLLRFMENHDEQRLASDFIVKDGMLAFPAMVVSTLIDHGSVMTYFAQELGERGMEEEGYSGKDGRTTIFDYWSLDSLQKWIGNSEYSSKALEGSAQELRNLYQRLLHAKLDYESIWDSSYYDLGYCNKGGTIPHHSLSVFLRGGQKHFALVLSNFSSYQSSLYELQIPEHAYALLKIPVDAVWEAKELFSLQSCTMQLSPKNALQLNIKPHTSQVWIFSCLEENATV